MKFKITLNLFIAITLSLSPLTAEAYEPLFELNLVGGGGSVPDYPASDQHHIKTLVLPFATYRGESVRANYDGIQADVVKRAKLGADASVGFSLPSSSASNVARQGMSNIDTLIEVGPRLYLLMPTKSKMDFRFVFPVRAVIATDLRRWTDRGLLFAPGFMFKVPLSQNGKSELVTQFGVNFATNRLHQYFYEVLPQFAQADRPAFDTRAGYMGTRIISVYSIGHDRFRYFAAAGLQSYKDAASSDSPLHRKDHDATIFGGVIWSFYHSDTKSNKKLEPLTKEL